MSASSSNMEANTPETASNSVSSSTITYSAYILKDISTDTDAEAEYVICLLYTSRCV